MTKSIQQVKQDLENLKSTVANTAVELEELHLSYLDSLSESLQQQLILACYQICTQIYPQTFLNLSLREKQDLQQTLRGIGTQLKSELIEIINHKELEPEPSEVNLMAELIKNLPKSKRSKDENQENPPEIDLELVKSELENIEFIEISSALEEEESEPESEALPKEKIDFENPEHLIIWHKQIERGVKRALDLTSRKVNKCLQDYRVIAERIPHKVIEVAMQADSAKGARNNPKSPAFPHVLQLAIETDKNKKRPSFPKPAHISLLRLRLAELEFADHLLSAKRREIRNLMGKVVKLNSKYKAIQQEVAVIEAQAAWRSSWYED
ncbi:MAG: hypothetical protein AAF298_09750 [Cyanobacteria bacterium P01_A01_bin.40]